MQSWTVVPQIIWKAVKYLFLIVFSSIVGAQLGTGVGLGGRATFPMFNESEIVMNSTSRNVLAVISGIVVGSLVNMGLIGIGSFVVPPPEGADVSTMENLRDSMKLFKPVNFLFPFLAHALGTLSGAFVAARVAASRPLMIAMGISVCFFIGGAIMVSVLGGPMWFNVADLLLAYIPMGYLGGILARGKEAHAL